MDSPRVGLVTFGDARDHEWEVVFRRLAVPLHNDAVSYFQSMPIELHASADVARTKQEIYDQVDKLRALDVDCLVAHLPCWTAPNLVVLAVQRLAVPTILVSNRSMATHGSVALLGAGGALDQIGYQHLRVRDDFSGDEVRNATLPLMRAASAVRRLRGQVFGLFGGRSIGIDTGTIDPMQWRRMFGIDVEHIDQLEIIRRADMMADERAADAVDWLTSRVGNVAYDGRALTPERLAYQVKCYLATKEIIAEKSLDFIAIQDLPELAANHIPQCVSAALVPSPYDAEGPKAPIAMACEADGDGALSMQMLKLVSGGIPPFFADLSYLNDKTGTIYLPNCGALCSWYAARSSDPAQNLNQIELRPSIRTGGGATFYFKAAPGPMTLARLFRKSGQYHMAILSGETVEPGADEYAAFVEARGKHQLPTAFVKVEADLDELVRTFGSNHISGVAGVFVRELKALCELLDITPELLT